MDSKGLWLPQLPHSGGLYGENHHQSLQDAVPCVIEFSGYDTRSRATASCSTQNTIDLIPPESEKCRVIDCKGKVNVVYLPGKEISRCGE
jgi:hypothetical protein